MTHFHIGTDLVDGHNMYEVKKQLNDNLRVAEDKLNALCTSKTQVKLAILFHDYASHGNRGQTMCTNFEAILTEIDKLRRQIRIYHTHLDNIARLEINLHIIRAGVKVVETELGRVIGPTLI